MRKEDGKERLKKNKGGEVKLKKIVGKMRNRKEESVYEEKEETDKKKTSRIKQMK